MVDKADVLRQLEGDYLLDYALFTGVLREYVIRSLEQLFKADGSDLYRRLFVLALFREEYTAYEDLGAILDALLKQRADPGLPLLGSLLDYKPVEVRLATVMERFEINSWQRLHEQLGFGELVPAGWAEKHPGYDLAKTLRVAAQFFYLDCVGNQKSPGVKAFNKLKHGLMALPSAKRYLNETMLDIPAMLFATDKASESAAEYPLTAYAIPMADENIDGRLKSLHFIQANLRLICGLLVVMRHPDAPKRRVDADPLNMFATKHLEDVMQFVREVAEKSPDPAG